MPDDTITTENMEQPAVPDGGTVDAAELDRLRKLAAERDQYLDIAQRTRAEFENYQKRARKERDDERRYLNSAFAYDLLPVIDNLERALQAAQQAGETGALVQGVALVQNQVLEQLKRHGVARIDAQGKPFDPNVHQAVLQQPGGDQVEPGTVLQVIEPGYMIHERVLRPAKVIVSS